MKKNLFKIRIATVLICALFVNQVSFAAQFFYDNGKMKYLDDNGKIATGWRWLDLNGDNICECYRFDANGALATVSKVKGKEINKHGQWVVDGVVQQIYKSTGKPLYSSNAALGEKDTNEYLDLGTMSTTRRLNATKKDIKALLEADANLDEEKRKRSLIGPKGTFEKPEEGYVLSRGATTKLKNRPIATKSQWLIITDALKEEEVRYLSASESIVAGKDMRKFVTSSNKYTERVNGAKIYGGAIWDDCMCLQGNGAYVKFSMVDSKSSFKANYFTFEVAHQTHGASTADTDCSLELYLNGKSITSYDEFCDEQPAIIEEWLDEGETSMELRAVITGDAPGRKIYIRNARFRQIKEAKEKD